jgi:hypothetical protein
MLLLHAILLQAQTVGAFEVLLEYGILGLIVLVLGTMTWFFIKRNLEEKDRLIKRLEDLNDEIRRDKK